MNVPSVIDLIYQSREKFSESSALLSAEKTYTYRDLVDSIEKAAAVCERLGLRTGMRVALALPNVPEFSFFYFALLRLGVQVIPILPRAKFGELQYILRDAAAEAIIASGAAADKIAAAAKDLPVVRKMFLLGPSGSGQGIDLLPRLAQSYQVPSRLGLSGNDEALICYTAGTSGAPKGAVLTHASLAHSARSIAETFLFSEHDCVLTVLPLSHLCGHLVSMTVPATVGARIVLNQEKDPEKVTARIAEHKVTCLIANPRFYDKLVSSSHDPGLLNSLRMCISTGAPLASQTFEKFLQKYNITILEGYGLSECSPLISCSRLYRQCKRGSVGLTLPDLEVAVFNHEKQEQPTGELGEIGVRGASLMKGYLHQNEAQGRRDTEAWFMTGDMGYVDPDGYLYIVGRKQERIIRDGFHIYPFEIESVLQRHPGVKAVAVIGVADPQHGEAIKAFIVPQPEKCIQINELRSFCQAHLASYKCPTYFDIVERIPRNTAGKVQRHKLKRSVESRKNGLKKGKK